MRYTTLLPLFSAASAVVAQYSIVKDYSGSSFFDGFKFFAGSDANMTYGRVDYLGLDAAKSNKLAYLNNNNHVILKVDNTTNVPMNSNRKSIRLEALDLYPKGSLIVLDAYHLPYGCSVWPSIWTAGLDWPKNGEIDIIEGVNDNTANRMGLHTSNVCVKTPGAKQTGKDDEVARDCASSESNGCGVVDSSPRSWGQSFAENKGGVWATTFNDTGVFIWFWSRNDVPADIKSNKTSLDPASWGTPTGAWPSNNGCNIAEHFGPQRLTLDVTLCGAWAGNPNVWNSSTCHSTKSTKADQCYEDYVLGDGKNYATAFFEIDSIRVYEDSAALAYSSSTAAAASSAATAVQPTVTRSHSNNAVVLGSPSVVWFGLIGVTIWGTAGSLLL